MEAMNDPTKPSLPPAVLSLMENHMAYFFCSYGLLMGYLAIFSDTSHWLFFKTAGFYIAFIIFFVIELLFIRKKIKF
jgi:intracellular septation protein A